jgi:Domain of unknown function (DUF4234)
MTQPVPAAAGPGAKGPIGEARNPTMIIILTIVTCGIYGLYWMYKNFEELKQHNGEGLGGVVGLLLSLVVVGYFMLPMEVQKTYEQDGKESPVNPIYGLFLFIPLIGFILYILKVQGALNDYWVSKGAAPVV